LGFLICVNWNLHLLVPSTYLVDKIKSQTLEFSMSANLFSFSSNFFSNRQILIRSFCKTIKCIYSFYDCRVCENDVYRLQEVWHGLFNNSSLSYKVIELRPVSHWGRLTENKGEKVVLDKGLAKRSEREGNHKGKRTPVGLR
jgi:hypothetical protein